MSDPSKKLRRRQCKGKRRYYTRYEAMCAIKAYERLQREYMNYYYCRIDGGHWHIGHSKTEAYQRIDTTLEIAKRRYEK